MSVETAGISIVLVPSVELSSKITAVVCGGSMSIDSMSTDSTSVQKY